MIPEIIFVDGEETIMRRKAKLADIKAFLKESNGQIDGEKVKEVHATLTSSLDLISVEFEME